ncbi:MAG: hypothetical protein FJX67_08610 [Alphaproteobacteria bacterium]|nr:hypothetical protein [Alphaproteobacteria bacterium]
MAAERRPVYVAGAGPVGLAAGLYLASRGVPVVVCEGEQGLTEDLRAGSYHPPTLEMLAPFGVTDRMHETGVIVRHWQIRDRHEGLLADFDLGLLAGETPYPYRLQLEQHKLTPLLLEAAERFPDFSIRFSTRVAGATQDADGVRVMLEGPGRIETAEASFLIGADGHRSTVRAAMDVDFEGFTWPEMFLIVSTTYDFEPHGFAFATYIADPEEWVMMFKVPGFNPPALWRLAFPADPSRPREEIMDTDVVQRRLQGFMRREVPYEVVHRNGYRVHQRVAATFNLGRMLLAGDAAHVNNPLGGMGLNGGIHDAFNLGEKLAALWHGEADPAILDRYTRQRRPVQIEYVQEITIRNKRLVEEKDPAVRTERQDAVRRLGADPKAAFSYLMNTSMINMVRKAATID